MKSAILISIVLFGIVLRALFYSYSPPSNSYDDHFEAVSVQRTDIGEFSRAHPSACWQCYQPPLYYVSANVILNLTSSEATDVQRWKAVQAISFLASCFSLILCICALSVWRDTKAPDIAFFALALIVATLPRLLYTAAMPTNDALLEMWVSLGILGYGLYFKDGQKTDAGFSVILIATAGAALTKQSGLVLTAPLIFIVIAPIIFDWSSHRPSLARIGLAVITLIVSASDEIWRLNQTGIFLASNQDFFDYAKSQPPGNVQDISFISFRLLELLKEPFLNASTLDSFPTQLFARSWFDYERRFFPTTAMVKLTGAMIYLLAIPVTIFIAVSVVASAAAKPVGRRTLALLLIMACFLVIPALQTLRLPYYSSMKAVFFTPAVGAIVCLALQGSSYITETVGARKMLIFYILCLLSIAAATVVVFIISHDQAWNGGLSGPMWPLPPL